MKGMMRGLWLGVGLAVLAAAPAGAQELAVGTWAGVMSPPTGESVSVTYEVTRTDDGQTSIVMSAQGQSVAFQEVALEGDELTFRWGPDGRLACTLTRSDDGSFEGVCTGDGEGVLRMVPPVDQAQP